MYWGLFSVCLTIIQICYNIFQDGHNFISVIVPDRGMGSFIRCPSIGNPSETNYVLEQIKLELELRNTRCRLLVFTAPSALLSRVETVLTESLQPALFP
jgi:hypothetical protein